MTDKNLGITEVVLRDGHQSLLATRFRYEDMEEILSSMDEVGYWSVESWVAQYLIRVLDILVKIHGKELEK